MNIDLKGLTLSERILSVKSGKRVEAGDLAVVPVDQAMVVDSIAPDVIRIIEEDLGGVIQRPDCVSFVIDHVSPASNVEVAKAQKEAREYARARGINLFDVGRGICHQVLMEEGLARPGWIVLGSDSHSTTYGAVCAFGTGMGATDIALAAASGKTWLRVPETVRVNLHGERRPGVSAKDVALEIIRSITADGATYMALEYHGAERFTKSERMTIANLAVEAGAKVGLVPPSGSILSDYDVPDWLIVDEQAQYSKVVDVDLTALNPVVSAPFEVDNVFPVGEFKGTKVDQVFIGTCTNGRLDDLHIAAEILKDKRIADNTRLLVIPASSQVLEAAVADGTFATLLAAGAVFGTPGCGPCMGRHMGVLAPGEVCVSTSNRNFIGRMGSPDARIFLASPAVAAATALAGEITLPEGKSIYD
ncbi:MAG: 3-isopropylmalate dehydratase large subunit [Trueperaceae bacterium]|nr:3-isopropylmalate dehydratase large subunit [Trueperaceae bacterium]